MTNAHVLLAFTAAAVVAGAGHGVGGAQASTGTIRGRIGYAMDRVLIYATGGAAFTHTSDNVTLTGTGTIFNESSTNTGWTIGGGVEGAFAENWTARVEYLYVGTNVGQSGAIPVVGGTITEAGNIHDSLIRAGINFKFP